ncbi:hypothetical protein Bca4012_060129 [Brassica carinata]
MVLRCPLVTFSRLCFSESGLVSWRVEKCVYGSETEGIEAATSGFLSRMKASPAVDFFSCCDGVISDGLAFTRRLILCEDVDERVFWKL